MRRTSFHLLRLTVLDGRAAERGATDCAIGRPLLVEGAARVAAPAGRSDWGAAPDVPLPADPALRAALAEHWTRVGAAEHASVASFARFTLQLLALGAPPELVMDAQVAAADEVRHARLAYGLASRYAGAPVGPGPLPLADAAPALDARSVMHGLVSEACIGETLGAAELFAAADTCVDTRLAAALREAGHEEARHAALAWRTLRWLLATHPELREEAREALAEQVARADLSPGPFLDAPEHAVPGPLARRAVHRVTLAGIVATCIDGCITGT